MRYTRTRSFLVLFWLLRCRHLVACQGADVNAKGPISGSEHGLVYGTALEAAEQAKKPEVVALLRNVRQD